MFDFFQYEFHPTLYVTLNGPVRSEALEKFSEEMMKRIAESPERIIVLDLHELQAINSQGVGMIVQIWKKAQETGKTLRVLSNPKISPIFRIARLHQIMEIHTLETTTHSD